MVIGGNMLRECDRALREQGLDAETVRYDVVAAPVCKQDMFHGYNADQFRWHPQTGKSPKKPNYAIVEM